MNFREKAAAQHIGISPAWLRKQRKLRSGPPYVRINRTIIYRKVDLDKFLEKHLNIPDGGEGLREKVGTHNTPGRVAARRGVRHLGSR